MLTHEPVVCLLTRKSGTVDPALLTCTHTDRHAVLYVAYGIGLCVLKCDEGNDKIDHCIPGYFFICRYDVVKQRPVDPVIIMSLLKGDTEHILAFNICRHVIRIYLNHVVIAVLLCPEDLKSLLSVSGSNDTVRYFLCYISSCGCITYITECCPVTEGAQPVCTPCPYIGTGYG